MVTKRKPSAEMIVKFEVGKAEGRRKRRMDVRSVDPGLGGRRGVLIQDDVGESFVQMITVLS